MKNKICIISGSRSEYGILKPLLSKLVNDKEIEVDLVITGSHLSNEYGNTQSYIKEDGFIIAKRIYIPVDCKNIYDMLNSAGLAIQKFGKYFNKKKYNLAIVLGDRYEIFAASFSLAMFGIPIIHIHGGETSIGAVDEFMRHSITKMSMYHFVSCERYRKRVIQMGEDPKRVFNFGSLGVENIKHLKEKNNNYLLKRFNIDYRKDNYAMVVFHPTTMEIESYKYQIDNLIISLKHNNNIKYLIIESNADAGGVYINKKWRNEVNKNNNWALVTSLKTDEYLTFLKHAKFLIGNSSSGIIEAPSFKIPVINIGDRQKGRETSKCIINCGTNYLEIDNAIKSALSTKFAKIIKKSRNLYECRGTSTKMYKKIKSILAEEISVKKQFYDIKVNL